MSRLAAETEPVVVPRDATAERQGHLAGAGQAGGPTAAPSTAAAPREAPATGPATAPPAELEPLIARLEGRVAALEAALERRSRELRQLQGYLCLRDLAQWTRLAAGLLPLPRLAHEPIFWQETLELAVTDVPEALADLWASLYAAPPPARTAPR